MGNIHQVRVREELRKGKPGQRFDHLQDYMDTNLPNAGGRVLPSWAVTVDTADSIGDVLTITENTTGESASFTLTAATVANGSAGLTAAWNANPFLRGIGLAVDDTTDTVTITAQRFDADFDLEVTASGSSAISAVETEGAKGDPVTFGRAVYLDNDGNASLTYPGNALATDLVGICVLEESEPAQDLVSGLGPSGIQFPYRVTVGRRGRFYVEDGDSASFGDQIFIGTSAGAELGRFFNASGSGRTALPLANGKWLKPNVIELKQA